MTRVFAVVAVLVLIYTAIFSMPLDYPAGQVFTIEPGASVGEVADALVQQNAIHAAPAFVAVVHVMGGVVQAGPYALTPADTPLLAYRMARGAHGLAPQRITVREGMSVREIEALVGVDLPAHEEGYLFPDTYFVLAGASADEIVRIMRTRYNEQLAPLRTQIEASGRSEEEVIIMASLIQKEARQYETMRLVSGILWKRLAIGMPLQVDAVFGYINNRPTYSPSFADLEIDSPYNTYKYAGLPPGPIGNPGLDAIRAALDPEASPYLYYLTGADGTMHYARTFAEHVANRVHLR